MDNLTINGLEFEKRYDVNGVYLLKVNENNKKIIKNIRWKEVVEIFKFANKLY